MRHHGLKIAYFSGYILDTNQVHFSCDLVAKDGKGGVGYTGDSGDIEKYPCCGYGNHLSDIKDERYFYSLSKHWLNITYNW